MAKLTSKIPTRTLGKTGFQVSSLSLGCSPFGGVFGSLSFEDCRNITKESFKNGINYLDTSPFYGELKSELCLGRVLNSLSNNNNYDSFGINRQDYYLSTKVGRYGATNFDFSGRKIEESINESLDRLQTDYLDIVYVHDLEFATQIDQIWNETLPSLDNLKRNGKIKKIGISGRPLNVLDYVMKQYGYNKIDCVLTYNNYCLFDINLINFINKWKNKYNIGIIQGGFTGLGLLTTNAIPPEWNNAPKEFKVACKEAVKILPHLYKKYEIKSGLMDGNYDKVNSTISNSNNNMIDEDKNDLARLAFLFTHGYEGIDTMLVGMTNINQVDKNVYRAKSGLNDIDKEVINELQNTVFADIMNKGWYDDTMYENICKSMRNYWN